MTGLLTQTKSAIDACKVAVNRSVSCGFLDSDDALSQFHNTCMIRLRGMVAWLATDTSQVPSEHSSLEELEKVISIQHPHFPVVVDGADDVETTASKVEGDPSMSSPDTKANLPLPMVPRRATGKQTTDVGQVVQQHTQSIPSISSNPKFQAFQATQTSKQTQSIPSNPEFQAHSKHSKQL